jgi:hypothetical protein
MRIDTHIENTPMLLLFALLYIIIFGYWLRKRIISYDFKNRSTLLFLLDNYELIGAVLIGLGLLLLVIV